VLCYFSYYNFQTKLHALRLTLTTRKPGNLQDVVADIQKKFGPDAIRIVRSQTATPALSTGFAALDRLLDGGVPRGDLTEIVGSPTSGATTIALQVIAAAQREHDAALYFDLASAFDSDYARQQGVRFDDLMVVRAGFDTAVEALFDVVATGIPGVVAFNTFPVLSKTQHHQLAAVLTRLQPMLRHSRCALLALTPYSGSAGVLYAASVRLQVMRQAWRYQGQDVQGFDVQVTLTRHKAGGERRSARIHIPVDSGGDR
jgi:recombination protein RecA